MNIKKHSSLSDEFSSDENSVEDIIDEDGDTHNLNRLMIVGVQFVPEPDDRDSLLIDSVSCYLFTCNLKQSLLNYYLTYLISGIKILLNKVSKYCAVSVCDSRTSHSIKTLPKK